MLAPAAAFGRHTRVSRRAGAATIARLHADDTFKAQAALARAEISQARARGLTSPLGCAAEAKALGR